MDLLFPQDDCVRMHFKDSAKKIGFEELTVDCTANIHLLQPQDKISVLLIAWKKIGDYLTLNQYTPCAGNVVSWVGRHTLDIWFDRDWIACSAENKTSLIEHMMKVYPAAYITMHPYSWPYMFSIYRDPWMVEYLNVNFQRMNDPDSPDAFEAKDSEFIQQEGISLIILRMIKMFDFGMVKLVKRLCLRLLWTWHDETSTANRVMRSTPNASQYINCIRHIYLIAIRDSNGNKELLYVFECIKRNLHCYANETGPLESIALIIAKGLLECNTTLTEFLNTFLLGVPDVHLNNLFGSAVDKYVTFLTEYQLRKLHSQRQFIAQENVYTKLVKMFIKQRESSEDLMKEAAVVSEALFSGVNNLKALKYSYEQFKQLTRSEWQTTKVTLILGIICDVLNSLEEFKYIDDQETDELISKEQELATYYRDLANLLKRTPYLEQEVWLTTFSLHPCKEYMDAVTKCGSRNLRAIKKQAFKLKPFEAPKPTIENSLEEINKNVIEPPTSEKILEGVLARDIISPMTSAAFLASLSTTGNDIQEPVIETPMPVLAVQKPLKKPRVKKLAVENTEPIVKAKRGRPFGSTKAAKSNMLNAPAIVTKKKTVVAKHDAKDQDTSEVIYSAAAGVSENLSSRTLESLQYPTFALINSVTDTEALIKYTDYDDEELGQYQELNRILSNLNLQHSNHDDFLALLISPRYKRLTWTICWKILRKRCRELLTKDKKKTELVQQCMANANERLTYLNIDYEKYKDKPQIDYGSIENGYECFDTDSNDDDTTLKPVGIDPENSKENPLGETKPSKKKRTISTVKQSLSHRRAGTRKSIKKFMKGDTIERPSPAAQLIQKVENLGFRSTAFIEELSSKGCLSSPIYLDRPVYIVRMSPDDPNDFRTILTKDPNQLHRKSQIMAIDNSQTVSQEEWVDDENLQNESVTKNCDNLSAGQNISQTSVKSESDAQEPVSQTMPLVNPLSEIDTRININDKQQITSFNEVDIPFTLSHPVSDSSHTKTSDFSKADKTMTSIRFAQKDQPEDLTMPKVEKHSHIPMNLSQMKDHDSAQEPLNPVIIKNMQQSPILQKPAATSKLASSIPLLNSPARSNQPYPQSKLQHLLESELTDRERAIQYVQSLQSDFGTKSKYVVESSEVDVEQEDQVNCLQVEDESIQKFVARREKTNTRSLAKCHATYAQMKTADKQKSLQSSDRELEDIYDQNEAKYDQKAIRNSGQASTKYLQVDPERNQMSSYGPADLKLESPPKFTESSAHTNPMRPQKSPGSCLQPDPASQQLTVVGQADPEQLVAKSTHADPGTSQRSPPMFNNPGKIQKSKTPAVQKNVKEELKEWCCHIEAGPLKKAAEESEKAGTTAHLQGSSAIYEKVKSDCEQALKTQCFQTDFEGDPLSARNSPAAYEPVDFEPLQDSPLECKQVGFEHSQIPPFKCEKAGPEPTPEFPVAMPNDSNHCQKSAVQKNSSTRKSPIVLEQTLTQADITSELKVPDDENMNRPSEPARIIHHKELSRSTQQQTQKTAFSAPIKIVKMSVPIPTSCQPTSTEKLVLSRICGRIVAQVHKPRVSSVPEPSKAGASNFGSSSNVLKKVITVDAATSGSQSALRPENSKELATPKKSDERCEIQPKVVSQLQEQNESNIKLPEETRSAFCAGLMIDKNTTNDVKEEICRPMRTETHGRNKSFMVRIESHSVKNNVQLIASNISFNNAESVDSTHQPPAPMVSEETKSKKQIKEAVVSTANATNECTLNTSPSVKAKRLSLATFGVGFKSNNGQVANLMSTHPQKMSKESTSAKNKHYIEETAFRPTPTESKETQEKRKSPVENNVNKPNSESGKQDETDEIPCKMFKFDSDRNTTKEAEGDSPEPEDREPSCSHDRLLLQSTSTSLMTEQVNGNDDTNSSDFNISQMRSCTTDTLSSPTLSGEAKDDIVIDEDNVYKGHVQWWLDRASVAIQRMFGPEKSVDEFKNVMDQIKQGDSMELGPCYQMLHKIIQRGCRLTFDLAFIAELQKFINDDTTKDNNMAFVLLARANQEPEVILSLLKQNRYLDNTDISVHEIANNYKTLTRHGLGNTLLAPIVKVIVKGTASAKGDHHQTESEIVKPYKALEDFVQARRLAHSPTMYSNVIATNTIHKLEVPTLDDMSEDEENDLEREPSPRIHRSRKRHRTPSKVKPISDDIATQRSRSRKFRTHSVNVSWPDTSSNILSAQLDDTDSDMEASDIYECDLLGNESESGSDYVPRRTRQKLVRPMRLRCVSRRLASYALSSCPSPIVTRHMTTNSNIHYIKKSKASAANTYQLTTSEKFALKRHNCVDLKVKLNRLTVRDVSKCRRTYVRLTRHAIDVFLKNVGYTPRVSLENISSSSYRTRASERNITTKAKAIERRQMLNLGSSSESEEDEDDDETSSFNLLTKDWRTDDNRHNEDDDDADARSAHQNTFVNTNFVSNTSSASSSSSHTIERPSNSTVHTRKNSLCIEDQIGFLLKSDATPSHESDVNGTTEEVHNSKIEITNPIELNLLSLGQIQVSRTCKLNSTCQETAGTPHLVEHQGQVPAWTSKPTHTTIVDPFDFHSHILDQKDELQSIKSRASSPELLDHLVEPDPLSLDRQAMVSPRTLLVTNRPRFLITPPLELFDDPVESYSRFLVQQNETTPRTVSAICIAKPYKSLSIDESIVSNCLSYESQDVLSPETNRPNISTLPTPMPELVIEQGDRVPVCETQSRSLQISDVVIKLT